MERFKRSVRRRYNWFKRLSKWKKFAVIGGPILAILIIIPLATYIYFARDISNQDRLMNRNNTGIVLLDAHGKKFYSVGQAEHSDLVPLDKISKNMQQALIASEDKNFYEHSGFSPLSIGRALLTDVVMRDPTAYGGSTITQQLAKNTLLTNSKTFLRKYQELAISIAIERAYSKDQILEMYLNSVFFGENSFGIEDAADNYFNKKPSELSIAESAMLVGVLPAPSAYSPISGSMKYAKERQDTVLSRMVTNGYITEKQKDKAKKQKLDYAKPKKPQSNNPAPHYTNMVLSKLYEKYGEEKVTRSGFQVKTTLDLKMQKEAQKNIDQQMPYIESQGGSNASMVAIDPNNGAVRVLIGSRDYDNKKFGMVNMATTPRQPGSSWKPVYYSQALADGLITPSTIIQDVKTDFGGGYTPQNADRQFHGAVTVRSALDRSLNIPAIKVMQKLGLQRTIDTAKKFGVTTMKDASNYGPSLALGSQEVPLTEMTNIYAGFANAGEQNDIRIIDSINDKYGKKIFESKPESERMISAQGAYLISNILADDKARYPTFFGSLRVPGNKTAAVKTGTTNDNRDAWTIGYTPDIAVGVWVGNNDNDEMLNGGSGMAGPIWTRTMAGFIGNNDPSFDKPSGIVSAYVCSSNGQKASGPGAGVYQDVFLTAHQPSGSCSPIVKKEPKPEKEPEKEPEAPIVDDDEDETPANPIPPVPDPGDDDSDDDNGGSNSGGGNSNGGGSNNNNP